MWDTWISWQKGGTLFYFRLRTKQSYFPHNMNKFLKRKFRASLSLISIKNWQELFLTIKRECTHIFMYECMCIENSWHPASKEHFSLLLFRIYILAQWRKNKRTRIWVLGIWNKGNCNAACGQVTRNRFELTPKFIILLIYRNLLKPWPELAKPGRQLHK